MRKQHVLMWPASALLTGNGVAFILRVPGTRHGDWWSMNGWWIFAGTAAVSLLSKYLIKWRGSHIFNPSNFGLVLCFLILGRGRANPLDFWWGPMSVWLVLALGGDSRRRVPDPLAPQAACGSRSSSGSRSRSGSACSRCPGHVMLARWHLGPITGFHFWLVLVTSPEVLVFLFFMITDPKTAPRSQTHRLVYAVSLGLLASLDDRGGDDGVREQGGAASPRWRSCAWRSRSCVAGPSRSTGDSHWSRRPSCSPPSPA